MIWDLISSLWLSCFLCLKFSSSDFSFILLGLSARHLPPGSPPYPSPLLECPALPLLPAKPWLVGWNVWVRLGVPSLSDHPAPGSTARMARERGLSHSRGNASCFYLYILSSPAPPLLLEGLPSLLRSLTKAQEERVPGSPGGAAPHPGMLTVDRLLQANPFWHFLWVGCYGHSPDSLSPRADLSFSLIFGLGLSSQLFPTG